VVAFEGAVKRRIDVSLANHLRGRSSTLEILPSRRTHFFSWRGGAALQIRFYTDGMEIAKKISVLLFGDVLDRQQLGT